MADQVQENPAQSKSRLSESAQDVDRVTAALYEGYRAQLQGAPEGVRFIDVANKVARGQATPEERELGKQYIVAEIDRINNDQNMPAGDRVIASNYARKLAQSFETGTQAV